MNVLFAVPWDEEFGGVTSVVGNLAAHLKEAGHEVAFFFPGLSRSLRPGRSRWGHKKYELLVRPLWTLGSGLKALLTFCMFFPITIIQLTRLIRRHAIEVVNIHYPNECFVCFAVIRRLLPIKLVISIHGADFFPGKAGPSRFTRANRWLLSAADLVVAPSQAFLDEFLGGYPAAAEKSRVIHNGTDIREFDHPESPDTELAQKPYLLCIANFNPKKAIDVLLHAYASICNAVPADLVLVGDGPLRPMLENLAVESGIAGRVHFLGARGRRAVASLLHDCEMLILPSRSEPFGIVVLEAMASRKAVVATRVGGIPEFVEDGVNGLLVKADESVELAGAIQKLLNDAALRRTLGTNGHEIVKARFLVQHTGARYEQLFKNVLAQ